MYAEISIFFFSDGGGRSGVYLSIDANLELAEEEDCYDVFGYLKTLRQSRKGMVETLVTVNRIAVIRVALRRVGRRVGRGFIDVFFMNRTIVSLGEEGNNYTDLRSLATV